MEIFVDFGLFELIAASGIGLLAQAINRRPAIRGAALIVGIAAPAALLWLVRGDSLRWIAAVALGTSLVNSSIITSTAKPNAPDGAGPSTRPAVRSGRRKRYLP
ncbi:MAG TPA: hypothetical protein VF147_07105 [Vicinamibacterales bacterium]